MLLLVLFVDHWTDNAVAYFERWPASVVTQRIYNGDLRAAADYSALAPAGDPLYISTDFWLDLDQQTYLLYQPKRADVTWFYGPHGLPLPPQGGRATYVWTASAESSRDAALLPLFDRAQPVGELLRVATLDQGTVDAALESVGVRGLSVPLRYGDTLALVAAGSVPSGDGIDLVTRWRVLQPWSRDMPPKLSARLQDASGRTWAQTDELLALAYQGWQPGQEFVQVTHLAMPGDMPPGDYPAVVAIYDERNGQVGVAAGETWLTTIPPAALVPVMAGKQ